MAERKRRKPSNKIKPGTPHPTKANVVRGYDGRWVSKKHFETVTKARKGAERIKAEVQAKAKKGGALVKQAKGAVTKATKGGLLKIRKGDRGIVRAIKDTYKLGQDTRKSADAVYRAGKVTRKVHDQLVKGGKEFTKGTVEAGKATRRAYERLKPGGKIVKTKGSKIAKYNKPPSKIVKSPGGKVVRSPGGKVVKSPGGKVVKTVKDKGGKLTTKRTPQYKTDAKTTAKKTAQQSKDSARKKARWDKARTKQQRAASGSFNVKEEWNPKTNKWETRYGQGTTKPKQSGPFTKGKRFVEEISPKVKKGATKVLQKIRNIPGAKTLGKGISKVSPYAQGAAEIYGLGDHLAGGVRTGGNLYRRIKGKPLLEFKDSPLGIGKAPSHLKIKEKNEYLKKHGSLKGFYSRNKKKTNNKTTTKKTTTTPTTSTKSQLDQNIDNAKGWNKRQLQKKKAYREKFGKLSNIPAKEGNATIPGPKGKAVRINEDFGKKTDLTIKSKKKSGSKYPATIGGKKTSAIQKKLIDAGFTANQLAKKMEEHKKWKAARGRR